MKIVLMCLFLSTAISLTAQEKSDFVENNFANAYNTGEKYFLSRDFDNAKNYFLKAWEYKPDDINTLNYLMQISITKKNSSLVKYYSSRIIKLNPVDTDALLNLGVIELNKGNFKDAEKYILKVLDIQNENDLARYNLAVVYGSKGDFYSAITILKKLTMEYPNNGKYFQTLGLYYLSINLLDNAEEVFSKSLEIDHNLLEARKGLIIIYQNRNQFNRSAELLDELEIISPKLPQLNLLKAIQEYLNDNINSAIYYSQQEIKNYPLEVDTYYFLSDLYKSNGNQFKADSVMNKIVDLGISMEQPFIYQIIKSN